MIEKVSIDDKPEVIPNNDEYHLPKGVQWAKVYKQVLAYQLFFWENCIYIGRKVKSDDKAEGNAEYAFTKCSNFTIEVLQHMEDEKMPMKLVRIVNVKNRRRTFETESQNFVSLGNFMKMVEARGNYLWKGNAVHYEKLKAYLYNEMGDGRMITELGWQPEGFFAFNNMALNSTIIAYDKHGCFEHNGIQYYVPSANQIYKNNFTKFTNEKLVVCKGPEHLRFKDWAYQMKLVHRDHSYMAICFGIAASFSDFIFKQHKFFPMLFLYGEASTGKGNLINAIQHLFGDPQQPMTITGKANTDKAKIRKFAQFSNLIVFLEEYRNTVSEDTIEMLKGLWNRYGYERGNITSSYGTDVVPIRCGVMMTGNDYPVNDPLLTRLIIDEMLKVHFSSEEKENFGKLEKMMAEGYSHLMRDIIKERSFFEENYLQAYSSCKKDLSQLFLGISLVGRMIDNMAVLAGTFKVISQRLDFPFSLQELYDYMYEAMCRQNEKRDTSGDVQKFWDVFLDNVKNYKLQEGTDFKIEGELLMMYYNDTHRAYQRTFYDLYKGQGMGKNTLRDKLIKSNSFEETTKTTRIGSRNTSALVFNMKKINVDFEATLCGLIQRGVPKALQH